VGDQAAGKGCAAGRQADGARLGSRLDDDHLAAAATDVDPRQGVGGPPKGLRPDERDLLGTQARALAAYLASSPTSSSRVGPAISPCASTASP